MKILNKHNLPTPYVTAAQPYPPSEENRYRVSDLVTPPQISALYREHWDELEEDVIDRLWALAGQSKHYVLEQHTGEGIMSEQPLSMDLEGNVITGTVDVYENGVLSDYKNTSVWTVKHLLEDINNRMDYVLQVNYYKVLFEHQFPDLPVNQLQIVAECKDWRPSENKRYNDYPARIEVIPVPILELAQTLLGNALLNHIQAREGAPRPCTDEERWKRPDQYAVMKKGRKSALRVLDTEEEAQKWLDDQQFSLDLTIEKRPGAYVRCEEYCPVSKFCKQFNGGA